MAAKKKAFVPYGKKTSEKGEKMGKTMKKEKMCKDCKKGTDKCKC